MRILKAGVIYFLLLFALGWIMGPIRYIDDDDNTTGFLDWQGVLKAAEEAKAKIA